MVCVFDLVSDIRGLAVDVNTTSVLLVALSVFHMVILHRSFWLWVRVNVIFNVRIRARVFYAHEWV